MGDRSRFKFLPAMLPMCCVIRATVKIITLFFVTSLNNRCILICFCCNNVSFVQLFLCFFCLSLCLSVPHAFLIFVSFEELFICSLCLSLCLFVCHSRLTHFCFLCGPFHLFPLSFSLSICPSLFPHFCFFSATFHLFPLSFSLSVSFGEIFIFFLCLPLFLYVLSFFITVCLIFRLSF